MYKNTTLRVMLTLACVASLTGCDTNKGGAEAAVREEMTGPDSAKFGAFDYDEKTKRGCLTVNARNKMGGYTGDQQAYVERTERGWGTQGIGAVSRESCRKVHIERS